MSIVKVAPRGFDLTDTYAFTGTVSGVTAGSMVKISSQTASASSSISFTGIDSTYRTYCFKFINIHPQNDVANFHFNFSIDNGSNYNVVKTTTGFKAYHDESDTATALGYLGTTDLAQSTSYQLLYYSAGNGNDENASGELWLFNPSSSTYVKHFMTNLNVVEYTDFSENYYWAGYGNTTSPINAINFKMASGNIDDGIITMYGIA